MRPNRQWGIPIDTFSTTAAADRDGSTAPIPEAGTRRADTTMSLTSPTFLLCPPDHFGVEYVINPFMDLHEPVDLDLAHQQWRRLRATLELFGAQVKEQPAVKGLPDIVFTNNAALVCGSRALLSRFRHVERQGETEHNAKALRALGLEVHELHPDGGSFEGAADAIPVGEYLVCAYGPRTSRAAVPYLAEFAGLKPFAVELVDPRLYHLDMTFCQLNERSAIIAEMAFNKADLARLFELVPDPILITDEEALSFCGNAVVVGTNVLMHKASERLSAELAQRGFEVTEVPVGEFTKAGGSLRCLSLRLA